MENSFDNMIRKVCGWLCLMSVMFKISIKYVQFARKVSDKVAFMWYGTVLRFHGRKIETLTAAKTLAKLDF